MGEFASTKKNYMKAIDGMQTALEGESKGKAEALRMKKKLEADVAELETSLEHANAANQETQKSIKKYHNQIRDAQSKLEEEQRSDLTCQNQAIAGAKRKLESEMQTLHGDLDE